MLDFPMGIVSFTAVAVLAGLVVAFATMPAWFWIVPDGVELAALLIDGWPEAVAAMPLAAPAFIVLALAVRWLAAMHAGAGRMLLAPRHDAVLEATVTELQDSR